MVSCVQKDYPAVEPFLKHSEIPVHFPQCIFDSERLSLDLDTNYIKVQYKVDQDHVSFVVWRGLSEEKRKSNLIKNIESSELVAILNSSRESDYKQTVSYHSIHETMSVYIAEDSMRDYSIKTSIENYNHSDGIPKELIDKVMALQKQLYAGLY